MKSNNGNYPFQVLMLKVCFLFDFKSDTKPLENANKQIKIGIGRYNQSPGAPFKNLEGTSTNIQKPLEINCHFGHIF